MPSLVIENVPLPLFDQIQRLALARKRTLADTALEVLETAFRTVTPTRTEAPLPQEPFLTEDVCAPFTLPRPEGKPTRSVRIPAPLPSPHDLPDEE